MLWHTHLLHVHSASVKLRNNTNLNGIYGYSVTYFSLYFRCNFTSYEAQKLTQQKLRVASVDQCDTKARLLQKRLIGVLVCRPTTSARRAAYAPERRAALGGASAASDGEAEDRKRPARRIAALPGRLPPPPPPRVARVTAGGSSTGCKDLLF